MPATVLGLPTLPKDLKSISPYLQRADELKTKDPIMGYWCAYYAAQVGIALKSRDPASRTFLFELLGTLETMKNQIGPEEAIDNEAVSSAYVENFALKIFAMADNEDRKGQATRATAKKFLAAANFLEILSVFVNGSDTSAESTNAEKIRYAKWKAADIAKAYREGRKPTPGPAGSTEAESPPATQGETADGPESPSASRHARTASGSSPSSPPAIIRDTPPPPQITNLPPSPFTTTPGLADPRHLPLSPGAWSTAATPGTPGLHFDSVPSHPQPPRRELHVTNHTKDESSPTSQPSPTGSTGSNGTRRQVHFTPSVEAHLGSTSPPNILSPSEPSAAPAESNTPDPFTIEVMGAPSIEFLPSAPLYAPEPPGNNIASSPHAIPPPTNYAPPPPPYVPPLPPQPPSRPAAATAGMATLTPAPPEELTPQVIGRIQKHCKYAISALDYEDAEQARKELRAALQMLGG
ncbi:VTA1 family protein [Abortiporus biennis]